MSLAALTLAELSDAIGNGAVTSRAATETMLARIARGDGALNCFRTVEAEAALAAADDADREIRAGRRRGPLHGVPLAHKDIFRRRGRSSSGGTYPLEPPAAETATVIERLDEAGAITLGMLNLDEFAAGGTGINEHYGRTANPWAPAHIAGGSSGGSAAAVAARFACGALGSDTGGSTRLPAAMCGVVGLKPTYGRVSRHATLARAWSMDSPGPIARTAEDCALLLAAIAGADPSDPTAAAAPVPDYAAVLRRRDDLRGLTLGIAEGEAFAGVDTETAALIEAAGRVFASLGATVTPVAIPDIALLSDLQQVLVKCEAAALHGARLRHDPEGIGHSALSVIREGLLIPATRYIEALSLRGTLLDAYMRGVHAQVDVVLAPVIPGPALSATAAASNDDAEVEQLFTRGARFTRFANYLGIPALAVPCGFVGGLPVAFQLLGPPFAEARLLACAHLYQRATGFAEHAPAIIDAQDSPI